MRDLKDIIIKEQSEAPYLKYSNNSDVPTLTMLSQLEKLTQPLYGFYEELRDYRDSGHSNADKLIEKFREEINKLNEKVK